MNKKNSCINVVVTLFLLMNVAISFAQQIPVTNYLQKEYSAGTQNWSVAQQLNNFMYFGNNYGLLEFDGLRWHLYGVNNSSAVRSIEISQDGTIYIGADNEYGYFKYDKNGELAYTSMAATALAKHTNFENVWNIFECEGYLYVITRNYIFIHNLSSGEFEEINTENYTLCSARMGNRIFIARNDGIYEISTNRVSRRIEGTDYISRYGICCMCESGDGQLLIGTKSAGLYRMNQEKKVEKFETEIDKYIASNQLYAITASKEHIAFGTVTGGVALTNESGGDAQYITMTNGLQNNTVLNLSFCGESILWCCLDQGIDRINVDSPMAQLYGKQNSVGTGYAMAIRNESSNGKTLFLGTNRGLYYTAIDSEVNLGKNTKLETHLFKESIGQVWNIDTLNGDYFCCHNRGLFKIDNNHLTPIFEGEGMWRLRKTGNPDVAIVGSYSGLYKLTKVNGKYEISHIEGIKSSCRTFEIDNIGRIWLITDNGIERISLNEDCTIATSQVVLKHPGGIVYHNIIKVDNEIVLSQGEKSYVVNRHGELSDEDGVLTHCVGRNRYYSDIKIDNEGYIWFIIGDALYVRRCDKEGAYEPQVIQLWNVPQLYVYGYSQITTLGNGQAIVNCVDGYVLADAQNAVKAFDPSRAKAFIRQIESLNASSKKKYYSEQVPRQIHDIVIPYNDNSIRIDFGSIQCCDNNVEFSFALVGEDGVESYSEWGLQSSKEYTFLKQGRYTFKLRLLLNGIYVVDTQTMSFEVLPPWWETTWAKSLWFLLALILIVVVLYIVQRRYVRARMKIIRQNEEELRRQQELYEQERLRQQQEILRNEKEILELRNEKIESELRSKSEELSNILLNNLSRNEMIDKVKHDLSRVADKIEAKDAKEAMKRISLLQEKLTSYAEDRVNWKRFEENFDEVNGRFMQKLQEKYPWISDNEKRLCVYINMGLRNKEIAPLMSISLRGIEMIRYRLRKKMELTREEGLEEMLKELINAG